MTEDLQKRVRIFIKCTAKWQQLNQNTLGFFCICKIWILCGERERVIFNQTNWDEIVGKLYWFLAKLCWPKYWQGRFVLGKQEKMGEKTHIVTPDVDFSFSTLVNNKPVSIKLKAIFQRGKYYPNKTRKRQLWQCIYLESAKLN